MGTQYDRTQLQRNIDVPFHHDIATMTTVQLLVAPRSSSAMRTFDDHQAQVMLWKWTTINDTIIVVAENNRCPSLGG
jgi:hypothetical protein